METGAERRRRKLIALVEKHKGKGGCTYVAEKADLVPNAIDQVVKGALLPKKKDGSRSMRGLGDEAARAIEAAFELGAGWFDADDLADTQEAPRKPVGMSAYAQWLAEALDRIADPEEHARAFTAAMDVIKGKASIQPAAEAIEANGAEPQKLKTGTR